MIEAADAAGVQHFVLLSMIEASPTAPSALARAKGEAERALRASSLGWTILRPSAYMETWGSLLGDPILGTGRAQIFGRGTNPVNFVAARDVAMLVERAVVDPAMRGRVVDVVGPENLSMLDVVGLFRATLQRPCQSGTCRRPLCACCHSCWSRGSQSWRVRSRWHSPWTPSICAPTTARSGTSSQSSRAPDSRRSWQRASPNGAPERADPAGRGTSSTELPLACAWVTGAASSDVPASLTGTASGGLPWSMFATPAEQPLSCRSP